MAQSSSALTLSAGFCSSGVCGWSAGLRMDRLCWIRKRPRVLLLCLSMELSAVETMPPHPAFFIIYAYQAANTTAYGVGGSIHAGITQLYTQRLMGTFGKWVDFFPVIWLFPFIYLFLQLVAQSVVTWPQIWGCEFKFCLP